jgi:hypothetical protein
MEEMARLHPESVTILQLGHTGEEREMLGMKISAPGTGPKLGFVVLGPQHAREVCIFPLSRALYSAIAQWVATSTALYIAHALLSNASEPNSLASLLQVYVSLLTTPLSRPSRTPGLPHHTISESGWLRVYLGRRSLLVCPPTFVSF